MIKEKIMKQWCDTFPPLNLWNYSNYWKWFPYDFGDITIEEIVEDFKELMAVDSHKGKK